MNAPSPYRRGLLAVLAVVLASALIVIATVRPGTQTRAAQNLGSLGESLGRFQLTEASGRTVSESDLADRVCVFSFIFTRCQLSCPRISGVMKELQERFTGTSVQLVSLSVDPERDTPEVMRAYGQSFEANPSRWWFLTGPRPDIYELIQGKFKLSVAENPSPDSDGSSEAIAHSDRLALVDHGRILGLYDSTSPERLDELVNEAKRLALPDWIRTLPAVNATLNGLCAFWLVLGWLQIRRPRPDASGALLEQPRVRNHAVCMILAVLTSTAFLVCYLVYHFQAGSVAFRGQGIIRLVYFTVLLSHTLLATFGVVPLVILTLARAFKTDFFRHRSVAVIVLPVWLYVSITGVVIFFMLYRMPIP